MSLKKKTRIVGLYSELTNMLMADGEELADYLARFEKIVVALNRAKETLSDALLVAMVLKGLTDEYNPFSVHLTQTKETLTFTEFKTRLRSFECTLRYCNKPRTDEVMMAKHKAPRPSYKARDEKYFNGECFICEKVGHRARDCRSKEKKNLRHNTRGDQLCTWREQDSDHLRDITGLCTCERETKTAEGREGHIHSQSE